MTQMSDEEFHTFIERIKALASVIEEVPASQGNRRIEKCDLSFDTYRIAYDDDPLDVDSWITAVENYKKMEGISDNDALMGLPLLLDYHAKDWWISVRRDVTTWQSAMQLLRDHFSPIKPSYQIYMEIFENKQGSTETIDQFVCKQRALLAKLPGLCLWFTAAQVSRAYT